MHWAQVNRAFSRVLTLALAVLVAVLTLALPARAETAPIAVQLQRITPLIPGDGDTLRISGTAINTTTRELTDVQVRLRISRAPIANLNDEQGANQILDSTRASVAQSLEPRAQRPFALAVPFSSLPLAGDGVYALGVDLVGRNSNGGNETVLGSTETLITWFPKPDRVTPISLVWLWPLIQWPARDVNGVLLDSNTPDAISPGGRLDTLLQVGAKYPRLVSWILDPALLQTVADMTNGYEVRKSGELFIGSRVTEAQTWLDTLRTTLADARAAGVADGPLPARVLPYADVDAVAVTRAGMDADVVRSVTQAEPIAADILGEPTRGVVSWAPFGRLDGIADDVLVAAGTDAFILGGYAYTTAEGQPARGKVDVVTKTGSVPGVLIEPRLMNTLSLPQASADQALEVRQRFLAQTALLAQQLPKEGQRSVVAGPRNLMWSGSADTLTDLLRATLRAPWLDGQTLTTLLEAAPTTSDGPSSGLNRANYGKKARAAELPANYLARIERINTELAAFTAIVDNPVGISDAYSSAILRAQSATWRTDTNTGDALVRSIGQQLREQINLVRVLSTGTVTLSGDTGKVPVTIANDLDRAITVGVTLVGTPSARLSADAVTDISIEPGKKTSVEIQARVIGGRELPVRVQLLTPEGSNYGTPATITVVSTAYARAASWVVAAAFGAILIFVVIGVIRRITKARASTGSAPPSETV